MFVAVNVKVCVPTVFGKTTYGKGLYVVPETDQVPPCPIVTIPVVPASRCTFKTYVEPICKLLISWYIPVKLVELALSKVILPLETVAALALVNEPPVTLYCCQMFNGIKLLIAAP